MLEVVEAEADNLAGSRHRQRVFEFHERPLGRRRRAPCNVGEWLEIAATLPEHRGEIIRHRRIDRLEIDDLIALEDAEPQALIRSEADNFHKRTSREWLCDKSIGQRRPNLRPVIAREGGALSNHKLRS